MDKHRQDQRDYICIAYRARRIYYISNHFYNTRHNIYKFLAIKMDKLDVTFSPKRSE